MPGYEEKLRRELRGAAKDATERICGRLTGLSRAAAAHAEKLVREGRLSAKKAIRAAARAVRKAAFR